MIFLHFFFRRLWRSIPLFLGVSIIMFCFMVFFTPDAAYLLVGKNPTIHDMDKVSHFLGHDEPFLIRFFVHMKEFFVFGFSYRYFMPVDELFAKTLPISIIVHLPGFLIGNVLAILLALWGVKNPQGIHDRLVMFFSIVGLSLSFPIVAIFVQIIFCSASGLDLFPIQGWEVDDFASYFKYSFASIFVHIFSNTSYNTRFFRSLFIEELKRDYVKTLLAVGYSKWSVLRQGVLKNCLPAVFARIFFSIPYLVLGGGVILEKLFAIPGAGQVVYEGMFSGDIPIMKASVMIFCVFYVAAQIASDWLLLRVEPRARKT